MPNKLVRDKIPEIIKKDGKKPVTHIASDEEYWDRLKDKLVEEVDEFIEESTEEELADIIEVINAICEHKNFDKDSLEQLRKKKAEERGGFQDKIILDRME